MYIEKFLENRTSDIYNIDSILESMCIIQESFEENCKLLTESYIVLEDSNKVLEVLTEGFLSKAISFIKKIIKWIGNIISSIFKKITKKQDEKIIFDKKTDKVYKTEKLSSNTELYKKIEQLMKKSREAVFCKEIIDNDKVDLLDNITNKYEDLFSKITHDDLISNMANINSSKYISPEESKFVRVTKELIKEVKKIGINKLICINDKEIDINKFSELDDEGKIKLDLNNLYAYLEERETKIRLKKLDSWKNMTFERIYNEIESILYSKNSSFDMSSLEEKCNDFKKVFENFQKQIEKSKVLKPEEINLIIKTISILFSYISNNLQIIKKFSFYNDCFNTLYRKIRELIYNYFFFSNTKEGKERAEYVKNRDQEYYKKLEINLQNEYKNKGIKGVRRYITNYTTYHYFPKLINIAEKYYKNELYEMHDWKEMNYDYDSNTELFVRLNIDLSRNFSKERVELMEKIAKDIEESRRINE